MLRRPVLNYLPNMLTVSRLLLALPLGVLIVHEYYVWSLIVGVLAGLSDVLDGFAARRLGVTSQVGAVLDPVADKTLITVSFLSLAWIGLIPYWLAGLVILRDIVIVAGAVAYYLLFDDLKMAPTWFGKATMAIQTGFCVSILLQALSGFIPQVLLDSWFYLVVFGTVGSGFHYVQSWTSRALKNSRNRPY